MKSLTVATLFSTYKPSTMWQLECNRQIDRQTSRQTDTETNTHTHRTTTVPFRRMHAEGNDETALMHTAAQAHEYEMNNISSSNNYGSLIMC
jgi:hypothetical protein